MFKLTSYFLILSFCTARKRKKWEHNKKKEERGGGKKKGMNMKRERICEEVNKKMDR